MLTPIGIGSRPGGVSRLSEQLNAPDVCGQDTPHRSKYKEFDYSEWFRSV